MNPRKLLSTAITFIALGSALSALAQTTIYEQSRVGGTTGGANNPDFTLNGFTSTLSANKSTAPGLPGGSSSSRLASTSIAAGPGTNFVVSPNHTTNGQLVIGTSYSVAVTFGSTGNNETSDLVVTTSDTGTTGIDTFAGTSTCFQSGNGYNVWIPVGNVTIASATPTFTFAYLSGTTARWYVDSIRFTPLPPPPTAQYWDTGSIGGSGNWDTTTPNWNTSSTGTGTQQTYVQSDAAGFLSPAGTVTITDLVNGITTDGGLNFLTGGYVITGGPLTLDATSGPGTNIVVLSGDTATINSVISGTAGLCNAGPGTLNLGAVNNFTGTVTLSAGKLHLNPNANQTWTSLQGTAALALGANTLTVGDSTSTTYAGVLSDGGSATPGALIKQGSGTLVLGGANTYAGPTTVSAGTLSISKDGNLGTAPASLVANQLTLNGNGATLFGTAAITVNSTRGITLNGSNNIVMTTANREITLNSPIVGPGSLTIPAAWPDFNATNTFAGDLLFAATNNISARFNTNNSAGSGTLHIMPLLVSGTPITIRNFAPTGGSATLPNNIFYDESVTNAQGYYIDTAGATGSFTLTGNISGTARGGVNINDNSSANSGGTVTLSGNNSAFSGGFNLEGGTLVVGSSTALGTGNFVINESSENNPSMTIEAALPLTGAAAITNAVFVDVAGSFVIAGSNPIEFSGPFHLGAGGGVSLQVNNTAPTILSGSVDDQGQNLNLTLNSAGSSVLVLKGSNSYTGGTLINSGMLDAQGSNSIPGVVYLNGGATLQLDSPYAIAPTAVLNVSSASVVNLNFHGYQAVSTVYLNGSSLPYGVYGATTNNTYGVFTGTGLLVVAPALAITSEYLDATGTNFVICWQSVSGDNYDVLTNNNLNAPAAWMPANPSPITASGSTTCYTLPGGISSSNVFVTIRVNNP